MPIRSRSAQSADGFRRFTRFAGRGGTGCGGRAGRGPQGSRYLGPRGWRPRRHAASLDACLGKRWRVRSTPRWTLRQSPRSEYLRSDARVVTRFARMHGGSPLWQAWAGMEHSVRSGKPSFNHVHGSPVFDYLAAHPESARRFDRGMATSSRLMNEALVEAYEWGQFGTLVDVAGGVGKHAGAILRAKPVIKGCSSICHMSSSAVGITWPRKASQRGAGSRPAAFSMRFRLGPMPIS